MNNPSFLIRGILLGGAYLVDTQYAFAANTPVLTNPASFSSFSGLLAALIGIMTKVGVPIAIFFIIFAGFKFVTARGNEKSIDEAKKTLGYAIVGTIVLLGASAIADVLTSTVSTLTP